MRSASPDEEAARGEDGARAREHGDAGELGAAAQAAAGVPAGELRDALRSMHRVQIAVSGGAAGSAAGTESPGGSAESPSRGRGARPPCGLPARPDARSAAHSACRRCHCAVIVSDNAVIVSDNDVQRGRAGSVPPALPPTSRLQRAR